MWKWVIGVSENVDIINGACGVESGYILFGEVDAADEVWTSDRMGNAACDLTSLSGEHFANSASEGYLRATTNCSIDGYACEETFHHSLDVLQHAPSGQCVFRCHNWVTISKNKGLPIGFERP
jgi:hypothetical protein